MPHELVVRLFNRFTTPECASGPVIMCEGASEHGMCEYGDVRVIGYVRVVRS